MALDSDFWDTAFCFVDNDTLAIWSTVKLLEDDTEGEISEITQQKKQKKGDIVLGYNIKTSTYINLRKLPFVTLTEDVFRTFHRSSFTGSNRIQFNYGPGLSIQFEFRRY
jgi:hypothetical protein